MKPIITVKVISQILFLVEVKNRLFLMISKPQEKLNSSPKMKFLEPTKVFKVQLKKLLGSV
jgi:hypothetical protein